jgi:hypothetical protein
MNRDRSRNAVSSRGVLWVHSARPQLGISDLHYHVPLGIVGPERPHVYFLLGVGIAIESLEISAEARDAIEEELRSVEIPPSNSRPWRFRSNISYIPQTLSEITRLMSATKAYLYARLTTQVGAVLVGNLAEVKVRFFGENLNVIQDVAKRVPSLLRYTRSWCCNLTPIFPKPLNPQKLTSYSEAVASRRKPKSRRQAFSVRLVQRHIRRSAMTC